MLHPLKRPKCREIVTHSAHRQLNEVFQIMLSLFAIYERAYAYTDSIFYFTRHLIITSIIISNE